MMSTRTNRDATKVLQAHYSAAKIPLTLPGETRRALQSFVDEYDGNISEEESVRANGELKNFWERWVGDSPSKNASFVGALKELRPTLVREADIIDWWQVVVKPVLCGPGMRKSSLDDAQDFVLGCMVPDEDREEESSRSKVSDRMLSDLLGIYIARTRGLTEDDPFIAPENTQVAQQVESVLVAFGRKQPKELFHRLDELVFIASTRLQALTLLSSFLRHQTPHVYLVTNTPLIEHLLKCLMNDVSTSTLSVALTSLIMLLPHIPGSLEPHLPRLFLIYSRLLCWEKFSPQGSEAQRSLVIDDRHFTGPETDYGDVGIDPTWEKVRPNEGQVETATPELMTYFTYLYGLYPLNFMSYVRKPRRYLKNVEFPQAEAFDLDQAVIRSRTEQFRSVHLLHPNFYNSTIEDELNDPKWSKADPADVVADCHALCVNVKLALVSPGPPPTGKLPNVPPLHMFAGTSRSGQVSPSTSIHSLRSGNSWRDTQTTTASAPVGDGDSPILRPQDPPIDEHIHPALRPRSKANSTNRTSPSLDGSPYHAPRNGSRSPTKEKVDAPQTNLAYLQRDNTLLRNELNFERWHKAQYSQHISQLMRKNVKDATVEAETLNLINANRTLRLQLDQVRNAREATLKDSALTRKQASSLESNMSERFTNMKKEQETWRADAEELQKLRKENGQYRRVLLDTEARELNKAHRLEVVKRELEKMEDTQLELQHAQRKVREFEFREFEMERAKREQEILQHEKETLQMKVQRLQQDLERARHAYADKVAELESQLADSDAFSHRLGTQQLSPDLHMLVQQATADSQAKLAQLKKKHTVLMERHSDLEMEYEALKTQLDAGQSRRRGHTGQKFLRDSTSLSGGLGSSDEAYETLSEYNPTSDSVYTASTSDPTSRRFQSPIQGLPVSPPMSDATLHGTAGLAWKTSATRQGSLASTGSSGQATTFNQTAPLSREETARSAKSAFSDGSDGFGQKRKETIKPDSQVRVYGRGGAQNIKLKEKKDTDREDKPAKSKGGFRNLLKS